MTATGFPTLIWDLDGTLVECAKYYFEAKERFIAMQTLRTGFDAAFIQSIADHVDAECVKRMGVTRGRFPGSFRATSLCLDGVLGQDPDVDAARESFGIGDDVFNAPYDLYESAKETLIQYRAGGWQMVVLTKGDHEVQENKLKMHGLDRVFDGVFVVPEKNAEVLNWIVYHCKVDPKRTWVIGDSLRDDIGPALELGLGTVHCDNRGPIWHSYEGKQAVRAERTVEYVRQMPTVLPTDPGRTMARHTGKPKLYEPEVIYTPETRTHKVETVPGTE